MRRASLFLSLMSGVIAGVFTMGCRQADLPASTLSILLPSASHPMPRAVASLPAPSLACNLVPGQDDDNRAWCLLQQLVTIDDSSTVAGGFNVQGWQIDPQKGMNQFQCPVNPSGPTLLQRPNAFLKAMRTPLQISDARKANSGAYAKAPPPDAGKPSTSNAGLASSQIAAILYNQQASESICNYLQDSRQENLNTALTDAAKHPDKAKTMSLQPGSVIIKTIWAEVTSSSQNAILAVWDNVATPELSLIPASNPPRIGPWQTVVHVNYDLPTANCQFQPPSDPSDYKKKAIQVSLGCFYSVRVTSEQRNAARSNVLSVNNLSDFDGGARYILLGFHVIAKGSSCWTWQTYWWDAQSFITGTSEFTTRQNNPFFNKANPQAPKNPFGNYIMKADSSVPLSNPYLEARLSNLSQSSCPACHISASFHPDNSNPDCLFSRASQGQPPSTCNPTSPPAPAFGTDMIWSLADLNVSGVTNPNQ